MHGTVLQRVGCLCVMVLLVVSTMAKAEDARPVKLSVNLISLYTDNRDSSAKGEDNIDLSVQPRVDVNMDKGDSSLVFSYAPSYRFRTEPADTQNDTQFLQELMLDASLSMGPRAAIRLMDNFYMTEDPAVQDFGTTLRRDSSFIYNRAMLGANVPLSRQMSADLSGSHSMKRYDEKERAKDADEDGLGGQASVWYGVSRQLGIALMGRFDTYDYESSLDLKRGLDTTVGAAGFDYLLSDRIRTELRLGWVQASYEDKVIKEESGPYFNLSVAASPQPDTKFTVAAGMTIRNSDIYPFASQEETYGSAGVDWKASERVKVDVTGQYRVGTYDEKTIPSGADAIFATSGDDKRMILSGGATFNLGDYTSLRIAQSHENVSTDVTVEYSRNSTTLMLSRVF
mgnify:CR=1 FL=1